MCKDIIVNSFSKIFWNRIITLNLEKLLELLDIAVCNLKEKKICKGLIFIKQVVVTSSSQFFHFFNSFELS
jgi:hypothetical protein